MYYEHKKQQTKTGITEKTFVNMLLKKELSKISVTDICKKTNLNRSTFYANYVDIYDLADKIREKIENAFNKAFSEKRNHNALTMFNLIYKNQIMFKIYFKLGYDKDSIVEFKNLEHEKNDLSKKHLPYHIEFFRNGLNAIIKMWLENGCRETPEEMAEILKNEYKGR